MPSKADEPRPHRIPRARYRVPNWPEYGRALQQRRILIVWVTPEALAAWQPPRTGQRGRPRDYSDVAIETGHLLPVAAGTSHETLRGRMLKRGEQLRCAALPLPRPSRRWLNLDSAYIRSCHPGERHLEVRVGNAEALKGGGRRVDAPLAWFVTAVHSGCSALLRTSAPTS